ncbi:MAG TPA: hypothetical protein VEB59_15395 [Gemmatimonadales bacterium]|nr:hypothetical protein [Gemmatimonadales bacterium]
MPSRWASLAAAALVAAPVPTAAQQVRELGVQAIGTASDPGFLGAGVYGAWRPSRRSRISLGAAIGGAGGQTAWRGELLAHFLLTPRARTGVGVYGGGGVAAVSGPIDQGFVVLTLGVESRPGAATGWFAEAGVGGGVRGAVGIRRRWF